MWNITVHWWEMVGLNYLVGLATYKNKKLEALVEGRPQVLIQDGKLFEDIMAGAKLTRHELQAALRQAGCTCVEDVRTAILENNGVISVVMRSGPGGGSGGGGGSDAAGQGKGGG